MALDWRCISYWKWGFSSHLLQRWKNTSCLVAALFGPGIASLCLLSPLDRGKPLQGTSPCTSCGVLEIGLTFWDVFGMMLKLPPDTGTNVPNHFSPFMCPSETCWLFLSLSDNLQAMYHLLIIPFDNMFFFTNIAFVCLQAILLYNHKTGWWFQRIFAFIPILGEMIQFDEHMFSNGLVQPPTRP